MIIAVDMDGTLCTEDRFPEIGKPKIDVINWCIYQRKLGHKVILWTCREGRYLLEAIWWCRDMGLDFDAVNQNIPETMSNVFGKHKIIADIYLDDKSMKLSDIYLLNNVEDFRRGK